MNEYLYFILSFSENEVDLASLKLLSHDTIKELVPKVGIRVRFLERFELYLKNLAPGSADQDVALGPKDQGVALGAANQGVALGPANQGVALGPANQDMEDVILYTCFKCYKRFSGLAQLFTHHRYIHNMHLNTSMKIVCLFVSFDV